jgi:hypothetical protein
MAPKIVCLSWCDEEKSDIIVGPDLIEKWLHSQLDDKDVLLVGHFVAYDCACALSNFPSINYKLWKKYSENRILCTVIREKLLDIATGEFKGGWKGRSYQKYNYSLQDIALRRLGKKIEKEDTWRLRYGELDGVPLDQWPQDAIDYSISDAETTFEVFQSQEQRALKSYYRIPTQFEDTRADFALYLTTCWGIRTDQQQVDKIWVQTINHMLSLVDGLKESGLAQPAKKKSASRCGLEVPAIKKSLKAIRAAIELYYPGGNPPTTPKGFIMTGEEVTSLCDFEPLQRVAEFSKLVKTANTYLTKLFMGIVHATFYSVGAASDRTSCSKPNLQNQPRLPGVRECFIPGVGRVFLGCDFDAQEMRTLAQSCYDVVGYSKLGDRFKENPHFDPHLEFAASLCKISVDEAKRLKSIGDEEIKLKRQQSKCANFGYPGGLGAETFIDYAKGYGVNINLRESEELKDGWFKQWPEMVDYFKHVSSLVGSGGIGYQTIPQSGFVRGNVGYCDAANGYFQTLAAHASKRAYFEACRRAYCERNSALYGSRPVAFIHDEGIFDTPEEAGHEAGMELQELMVECMQKYTPDVPAAASSTLMRRWSKKAEPTYKNGRLVVWEG